MTGPAAGSSAAGHRRPTGRPAGTRTGYVDAGDQPVIRAAGGVPWRVVGGEVQVCLVHRPRYDDWSLPKGKLEPDEHPLVAAVREVAEETGWYAVPQVRLPPVRYRSAGVPKVVDYWSMLADPDPVCAGGPAEVDLVRWVALPDAVGLVSYPHDAMVLRAFAGLPPVTTVLGLVRHGWAGRRGTWPGPDSARPLDDRGRAQARVLAAPLALLRPQRLRAASVRRCVETLGPLAEALDLPVGVDGRLDEPGPGGDVGESSVVMAGCLVEFGAAGGHAVLCAQGRVIPGALRILAAGSGAGPATGDDLATGRGEGWLLAFGPRGFVTATRL
jgi:8-oxo-dGTP pyrophosphatase MutT (NUDIX family)